MNCFVTRHALWIVMRHIRCELLRGFHCELLCGMRWEWLRSLCYEFLRGQLCIYCLAIFTDYKTFKATTFKHVIYFYSNLSKSYCGTERFNRYHFDKHIYKLTLTFMYFSVKKGRIWNINPKPLCKSTCLVLDKLMLEDFFSPEASVSLSSCCNWLDCLIYCL